MDGEVSCGIFSPFRYSSLLQAGEAIDTYRGAGIATVASSVGPLDTLLYSDGQHTAVGAEMLLKLCL